MCYLDYYKSKKVLVTGHTGFKGGWLTMWLNELGAHVTGLSIDIPTKPSFFELTKLDAMCTHNFGDINDLGYLNNFVSEGKFDIIFHLAAQPLVRYSYQNPIETVQTNIMGTANLLEAVRLAGHECIIVAITSDKCYANNGSFWGFRETDPMGGGDPYSMSKGAAELLIDSWRYSYWSSDNSPVKLCSARAGNVIGGGDWAKDRIVPDLVLSLLNGRPLEVRNPDAIRPWQHVNEPLSGYLWLGAVLGKDWKNEKFDSAWNFGPNIEDIKSVHDLIETFFAFYGKGDYVRKTDPGSPKEAKSLILNCEKALRVLDWKPVWGFEKSVEETAAWYKNYIDDRSLDLSAFTIQQIRKYINDARSKKLAWSISA